MSDNGSKSPEKATVQTSDKPLFSAKEEEVLKAAWHCLKSAPEIDISKLMDRCGFNTQKTASNTWGVIKRKLDLNVNVAGAASPSTPKKTPAKKAKATPLKRSKKSQSEVHAEETDDDEDFRSLKKARKSPEKKAKTKQQGEEEDEGDEA